MATFTAYSNDVGEWTRAPTDNDVDEFVLGYRWINTTTGDVYTRVKPARNATNVWAHLTDSGGSLPSNATFTSLTTGTLEATNHINVTEASRFEYVQITASGIICSSNDRTHVANLELEAKNNITFAHQDISPSNPNNPQSGDGFTYGSFVHNDSLKVTGFYFEGSGLYNNATRRAPALIFPEGTDNMLGFNTLVNGHRLVTIHDLKTNDRVLACYQTSGSTGSTAPPSDAGPLKVDVTTAGQFTVTASGTNNNASFMFFIIKNPAT